MRKLFLCLAIALLCTTFAVAQASSSSPSAQQTPNAQSSQSSQPAAQQPSSDQGAARSGSSAAQPDSDAARSQADQSPAPSGQQPRQQPQRAANGGVPWGWIVLGIVIVAILLGLIGRGTDTERVERSERVETINRGDRDVVVRDRRDDDIRRVG